MFIKEIKNGFIKFMYGKDSIPRGLYDLNQYFKFNDPISFDIVKEGNIFVAVSNNFRYGSIITQAETLEAIDENIKDAILTSFEIPSSYKQEAAILRCGNNYNI